MPQLEKLTLALGAGLSIAAAYAAGGVGVAAAVAATAASLFLGQTDRPPARPLPPGRVAPLAPRPAAGGGAAAPAAEVAAPVVETAIMPAPVGLPNPGNTCYLNAALQLIRANPTLIRGVIAGCGDQTAQFLDLQAQMGALEADEGRVPDAAIKAWRTFIPPFAHLFPEDMAIRDATWIRATADIASHIEHLPTIGHLFAQLQRGPLSADEIRALQEAIEAIHPDIRVGAQEDVSLVFRVLLNIASEAPRFDTVNTLEELAESTMRMTPGRDAYFDLGGPLRVGFPGPEVEIAGISLRLEGFARHLGTRASGHYIAYLRTPGGEYLCLNDATVSQVTEQEYVEASKGANLLHLRRI